jgi:hypothetical protein
MSVGGTELPLPQPIRLLAGAVREPGKSLQSLGNYFNFVVKSNQYKGRNPRAFVVVSKKHRPASV